ncbi:MAG TPA: hypothetical protein VHS78_14110 [Candidatus Elarobacter sp.]|jgi:hypothetical protein|nr:hypothetical protein [Candidatus Elarobacter sp.]
MASTYQQRIERGGDRSAMADKVARARLRVEGLERACAGSESQIADAQSHLDAIPAYDRGWPVEVIGILAVVAIVLEWYPARMMSLVFFFASKVELIALTAAFAVGGFLLGLLLGELLRRHRRPQLHGAVDWLVLGLGIAAVVAFLTMGYELRLAYATASSDAAQSPVPPVIQALALTTLAFIGIVIAFTSGYYRESIEAMAVRYRLGGARRRMRTSERHLEAVRFELEAAERAYALVAERASRAEGAAEAVNAADAAGVRREPAVDTVRGDVAGRNGEVSGPSVNGAASK